MNRCKRLPLALLLLSALASCGNEPQGQLVLALKTDMSLPKDIDRIRIEITNNDNGKVIYLQDFEGFDKPEGRRLPGTVNVWSADSNAPPIHIRVIASRGSLDSPRVLREIVTSVPPDRIAMIPVPIEFLCDGRVQAEYNESGHVKIDNAGKVSLNTGCPTGLTCKAGTCTTPTVPPESLLDYDEADVFGGGTSKGDGTCFDTSTCFDTGTEMVVLPNADNTVCIGTLPEEVIGSAFNIGLSTRGGGICGAKGCFVALDAESDAGWHTLDGNTISLPNAVCEKLAKHEIASVVAVRVAEEPCAQKLASIPTCGPWSASGGAKFPAAPDEFAPQFVATGQLNPVALGLSLNDIYWTSKGTLSDTPGHLGESNKDGTVNMAPQSGGQPFVFAEKQWAPARLTFDPKNELVLWTNEQGVNGGSVRWAPLYEHKTSEGMALLEQLQQPTGIAAVDDHILFTEIVTNQVHDVQTTFPSKALQVDMVRDIDTSSLAGKWPRDVAVDGNTVCWTYDRELPDGNGIIACESNKKTMPPIATNQPSPRAITLRRSGVKMFIYWANFVATGSVMRATLENGMTPVVESVADIAFPAGLAIDADKLYISSRSEGKIIRVPLDGPKVEPELVVEGRAAPGAIAIDGEFVFWIEESTQANKANGALVRMKKKP